MPRRFGIVRMACILFLFQSVAGCAWIDNEPIEMKLAGSTSQTTPCIAGNLGKEFQDTLPVVDRGNLPGSTEITVNAPRGGMLAFVKVDPLPSGDSQVTIYNGELYWPANNVSGVFPDVARDNWHRAQRAVMGCTNRPAA